MATLNVSATTLNYATSGSSWTGSRAIQGYYNGAYYAGAMRFPDVSNLPTAAITINSIELNLTFCDLGSQTGTKELHLYKAKSNTISGTLDGMLGDEISIVNATNAYGRTLKLGERDFKTPLAYATLKDYISKRNQTLIIYVKTHRNLNGAYCEDYLGISAASITINYD